MQAILTSKKDKRWHLSSNKFELIKAVRILSFPAAGDPMVQAAKAGGAFYSQSIEDRPHTGHQVGSSLLDREIYFQED